MLPGDSLQKKLNHIRAPRVHIVYDVEIGGAMQKKELPFVVGVLADLSGKPLEALPPLKHRAFVEIDRDNFDQVLAGVRPRLALRVDNRLQGNGSSLGVELNFTGLDDFAPEQVVRQVEPLRQLLEVRKRLSDLLIKVGNDERLDQALQDLGADPDKLKQLGAEAGRAQPLAEEA